MNRLGAQRPDQLRAFLRARCYPALEWGGVVIHEALERVGEPKLGNRNIPDEAFFFEVSFKPTVNGGLNVEEDKYASDIEGNSSHGEVASWTDPVRERVSVQRG